MLMGCIQIVLWVAKGGKKLLTALCHFLFSTEIGISGFGAGISHLFMSVLLWYEMLICYFSIKTRLHLSSYHGTTCSSPWVQACPPQEKKPPIWWENANVGELWLRLSTRAIDTDLQELQAGRRAAGSTEPSRSSHGSRSTRSWGCMGNLSEKESFVTRKRKENHACTLLCSPTQNQMGFLFGEHKSPVLMENSERFSSGLEQVAQRANTCSQLANWNAYLKG